MNALESDCLQASVSFTGISLSVVEELGSISLIASMISSSLKSNELKVDDIPGREFVVSLSSVFSGLLNTEENCSCRSCTIFSGLFNIEIFSV